MKNTKRIFIIIFILLAVMLVILPFLTTFSDFLTQLFLRFGFYRWIQQLIVPMETRTIAGFLQLLGYKTQAAPNTVGIFRHGAWETVTITWNCIGWQSLILMAITLVVGLQGQYTRLSKIECAVIGILGVVIVNLLRIIVITLLIFNFNQIPATVLHDYFSIFILVIWLFFFWWYSYSYILEESKEPVQAPSPDRS